MAITHTGGFESGIFGPNNWKGKQFNGDRITLVSDVVRSGDKAIRVEVRDGDQYANISQERSELLHMLDKNGNTITETVNSGTKYYGFSVRLDSNWKSPEGYGIIWQLHHNAINGEWGGQPPFTFRAQDRFFIRTNAGDVSGGKVNGKVIEFSDGSLNKGKWVDFIVKIKFSTSQSGEIDVWRRNEGDADFKQVLDVNTPTVQVANGQAIGSYHKAGLYRHGDTNFTNVLHLDGFVRGDNLNEVKATFPSGGGSSSGGGSTDEPAGGGDEPAAGGGNDSDPSSNGVFSFEAELAQRSGAFVVKSDGAASGNAYAVSTANNSGVLTFDIQNAVAGKYTLDARVLAPNHQDNSLFVKVNGGTAQTWHIDPAAGWQDAEFGPSITLKAGANALEILGREDGTGIDTVKLTPEFTVDSGSGSGTDEPTGGSGSSAGGGEEPTGGVSTVPTNGDDYLVGTSGVDTVKALSGNDTFSGGGGTDYFYGGSGADVVIAAPDQGAVKWFDFSDGTDKIQLTGGLSYGDLKIDSSMDAWNYTWVRDASGDKLVGLKNTTKSQLSSSDFIETSDGGDDAPSGGGGTSPDNKFSFEAEAGKVVPSFAVKSDGNASGGKYVEASQNYSGSLQFDIDNAVAGDYTLTARVLATTEQDNSFFVKVNGGAEQAWHISPAAGWQDAEFGPSITLAEGDNTLEILAREDGTGIDSLTLML